MPQSRGRIDVLAIKRGFVEPAQLGGVLHLKHEVFPKLFRESTAQDVQHVRAIHGDNVLRCPSSKARQ